MAECFTKCRNDARGAYETLKELLSSKFGVEEPGSVKKCQEIDFHSGWTQNGLWDINNLLQMGLKVVWVF